MRIAINGFGRIGRSVLREGWGNPHIDFVAINDLTDPATLAHLLKYDSVHGKFDVDIKHDNHNLIIDGKIIPIYAQIDPKKLPWKKLNVDYVLESTGRFLTRGLASLHIKAGAKKVILSAPGKSPDIFTFVKGVNEHEYNQDNIISNASCTTNCFAPIAKVINDNFTIVQGTMLTIHAYTADQRLQDAPHKDLRRARAAAINIVPTKTGAAKAVEQVIPGLKGKIDASALRVPIPLGSITYFTAFVEKETTAAEVNKLFKSVSETHMKGVLEYRDEPLVSSDIVGNKHSSIFDSQLTSVNGKMIRVASWYDNEIGYSNRILDILSHLQ